MNSYKIGSATDLRALERLPYAHFMAHSSVLAALEHSAALHGERPALTALDSAAPGAPPRRWTHAQYAAEVRRAAHLFARLAGNDIPRVALLLPPIPEAHFSLWGAETVGVACPINHQLNAEHVAALVRAAGANIVVALGPCAELDIWSCVQGLVASCPSVRHLLAVGGAPGALDFRAEIERESGDSLPSSGTAACTANPAARQGDAGRIAALFHTGGTTGAPKLAQHTQANQLHAAWSAAQMYGATERDVILNGFPLFHVAGSFVYGLSILLAGGEVVLPPMLAYRDPTFMAGYGDVVQRHHVTLLATVPTLIAALLSLPLQRAQLASVRALLTGGSPLPDELAAGFEQRHGIPVRNILGMTECAGVIAIEPLAAVASACPHPCPLPGGEGARPKRFSLSAQSSSPLRWSSPSSSSRGDLQTKFAASSMLPLPT